MDDKPKYLVFRVYSREECLEVPDRNPYRFYGWSGSKSVIKAFLQQRSKNKYQVRKMRDEDLAYYLSETDPDLLTLIDFVPLKVVATGEEVKFFTTRSELEETEKRIQRYFRNLSKIIDRTGSVEIFEMYRNLDQFYGESLDFIGFLPPEADDLFDVAEFGGATSETEKVAWEIEQAYLGTLDCPLEEMEHDGRIPGLMMISNVANKILYSMESFIKVLYEDM